MRKAYSVVVMNGGLMQTATKHSPDCSRVFNRLDATCPRCQELAAGASPRKGWNSRSSLESAARLNAIRAHDCKASNCGPVCTYGDW